MPLSAPDPSRAHPPDREPGIPPDLGGAPQVPPRPGGHRPGPQVDVAELVERARRRWEDPRVRAVALLVAATIAGLVWFRLGRSDPTDGGRAGVPPVTAGGAARVRATTSTTARELVVHVAGAVARPGVVRVRAGARVVDAIDAAGGGLPDAALDRLNLAAALVDGQRVAVTRVGEPAVPADSSAGPAAAPAGPGAPSGPLDLNAATQAQLEELPGIGPALAGAILRYRDEHGGFRSVGELQEVRGIGEARFADLEGLVTV